MGIKPHSSQMYHIGIILYTVIKWRESRFRDRHVRVLWYRDVGVDLVVTFNPDHV